MAAVWLAENPHDIEQFKKNFPDAMSMSRSLSPDEVLSSGVICAEKCPRLEDCILRADHPDCPIHPLIEIKAV